MRVTVDRVIYLRTAQTSDDRPHCFGYFITIHNDTESAVTVKARKWVVTEGEGRVTAVEGAGVVGQTPTIEPGESFSYNSFHLLADLRGVAEGSYLGIDATGQRVLTRIPRFEMTVPSEGAE